MKRTHFFPLLADLKSTHAPLSLSLSLFPPSLPPLETVVDGLKYAKSHEWAKIDGDTATVGITDFAQVRECRIFGQRQAKL